MILGFIFFYGLLNYLNLYQQELKDPFNFGDFNVKNEVKKGNVTAIKMLDLMHLFGVGVEKDGKNAAQLFEQAVDMGDADCMFNYARMLHKGADIDLDLNKACLYYRKEADAGNIDAMINLG